MRRREFLTGAASMVAAAGALQSQAKSAGGGLTSDVWTRSGFRASLADCPILFGCSLNLAKNSARLMEAIKHDMRLITPEGALKWAVLRPTPVTYDFNLADKYFAFATANNMRVRGQNLCWNDNALPQWLASTLTRQNAATYLIDHITRVVSRYRGQVQSWDVVNEAIIALDRRSDLLSAHPWTELIGPEYIDIAFKTAAAIDPHTPLVLNEVGMERNDAQGALNRAALLRLIYGLKSRGVPVHAIGLEGHIYTETPVGGKDFHRFLLELKSMDLDIYITELDVNDTRTSGSLQQRDQAVADQYGRYLDVVLQAVVPKVLVFWSYQNGNNWLDWLASVNTNARRADGEAHRPGIIDVNFEPTLAHTAIEMALRSFCGKR